MSTKKVVKRATTNKDPKRPKNIRAIANTKATGQKRFFLYKNAIEHIEKSIKDGYYLEAITLTESLVSDRLESRLAFITQSSSYDFSPLGNLLEGIRDNEIEEDLKNLCEIKTGKLYIWKENRNKSLHQMAKLEENDPKPDWKARKEECKKIAEDGFELFKNVRDLVAKYKRSVTATVVEKKVPTSKSSVKTKANSKK